MSLLLAVAFSLMEMEWKEGKTSSPSHLDEFFSCLRSGGHGCGVRCSQGFLFMGFCLGFLS